MKIGFGMLAGTAVFVLMASAPAQADPLDFFKSLVHRPHFDRMLPDGAYIMDEEDYYRYLKRKRTRRRAVEETYYQPEYDQGNDPVYTEPSRPKRKVAKPPVKSVAKPAPVRKKPAAVAVAKPEPSVITAPKPSTAIAVAKPPAPDTTASTTPSSGGMSCAKATQIVSGYGFDSVSPQACSGKVYAFNALRGGKSFLVRVDAASGELTEVKKVQ